MVKKSGLQLTDLAMPGWSKILWDEDGAQREVIPMTSAAFLMDLCAWIRTPEGYLRLDRNPQLSRSVN
jgi:hypothetical protein